MAVDLTNFNLSLQKFLKDGGYYKGPIDGKIGPKSRTAINKILDAYKIPHSRWSNSRRFIALEQIFYKEQKISVGAVDGKVGPLTTHAREVYAAKQVTGWRDTAEEIAAVVKPAPVVKVATASKVTRWPTQSGVRAFFGGVGTNQAQCELPFEMVLSWDMKTKLRRFSCHKLVKDPLERIWGRTLEWYGYAKIKELRLDRWGGCLNVRPMRGGSNYSMHAWGIAVDMDPDRNGLKTTWKNAAFSKPEYKKFIEFWYDEGFINLGVERNYDAMHFQAARLG